MNDEVHVAALWDPDGSGPLPQRLIVGGYFGSSGGFPAPYIVAHDFGGSAWLPLGAGVATLGGTGGVFALATAANGDLLAGGSIWGTVGNPLNGVARWNGTSWSSLGPGLNGNVQALCVMPNGDIVAAGSFSLPGPVVSYNIARWNGVSWSGLGSGLGSGGTDVVHALTSLPNGDLIAGGVFAAAGAVPADNLARWDGTSWSALGAGLPGPVYALKTLPDGDVLAGGQFVYSSGGTLAINIARWNGSAWSSFGGIGIGHIQIGATDHVRVITTLPNGDVVVGGDLPSHGGIARWTGTSWATFGGGVNGYVANWVNTLPMLPDGSLLVGGRYLYGGAFYSPNIASLAPTCPPSASAAGLGCPSSGGGNTLTATTLPWVDATFRAQGSGLPGFAIVVAATSFAPIAQGALPLASLFPQALAGCDLLVAPDILQLYVTTTGSAESSFLLPNTPPIVGLSFFHQMVPIELDALGNWVAITSTNSLQLTAGAF
jgi:hypothetical protein